MSYVRATGQWVVTRPEGSSSHRVITACSTRDEAMARAQAESRRGHVNVWDPQGRHIASMNRGKS